MITPIHITTIDGQRFRLFRTPLNDGRPDLPWFAVNDLLGLMDLPPEERARGLRASLSDGSVCRSITTSAGPVIIAPYWTGHATLCHMVEQGEAPVQWMLESANAAGEAMKVIMKDVPPEEQMSWFRIASRRWQPTQYDA